MSDSLVSPGVQVTVIDQSQFTSASAGTVAFILVATAANKLNQSGTIAPYTVPSTAGQLQLETSQRSLVNDFGAPIFENIQGTPVNGSELNEYGLMTAFSTLGVSDSAYIMRAPIDLASLSGSLIPPTGNVSNGTLWLDTATTSWGLFQFNAASQSFSSISTSNTSGNAKLWILTLASQTNGDSFTPISSIGKPGDYAVVTASVNNPVWYLNNSGTWVQVGSAAWQSSLPAVTGTSIVSGSVTGNLIINGSNIALNNANLLTVVSNIKTAGISGIGALPVSGRLGLTANYSATSNAIIVGAGSDANVLSSLGFSNLAGNNYYAPQLQSSGFTQVPQWLSTDAIPAPTGSVWFNTTPQQNGANVVVYSFNASTGTWTAQPVTLAANDAAANYAFDPLGGGINIPANTLYLETNAFNPTLESILLSRDNGPVIATGSNVTPSLVNGFAYTCNLVTSTPGNSTFSANTSISFNGPAAGNLVAAINNAGLIGLQAGFNVNGQVYVENMVGGTFFLYDVVGHGFGNVGINPGEYSGWSKPAYVVNSIAPTSDPSTSSVWYYNDPTTADILVNTGGTWASYRTLTTDARGYNLTLTDPNGPIASFSAPTTQSNGVTPVVAGDIWLNTSDLNNLPNIYRYTGSSWSPINNTDHTSTNGIIFADARWSAFGNVDPGLGVLTPISSLLTVNVASSLGLGISSAALDSDAPNAALYPRGTLLFNTRRSGMNIKVFTENYLSETSYQSIVSQNPIFTDTWVTKSGNNESGVAYQGSAAQRNIVVQSLISAVENSSQLLDEFYNFNLISCPGYPELLPTLVNLNLSRNETAFIVSDSPLTLAANATAINNWANNVNQAVTDNVDGLVTFYDYAATYYPDGLTTDLSGNNIVVPASFMALPTIIQSDAVSYPWFAPAGSRRGQVNNVSSIGYIDESTGSFITNSISKALRDILYPASVNPITNLPGSGIEIYGQKTRSGQSTELSRINVARLVVYLRSAINQIGAQYTFEQNDSVTRQGLAYQLGQFLNGIQAQRGITDYAVVCDLTNNSPAQIDANEIHADVAIAPTTSAEFIYIPISVIGQGVLSGSTVSGS